MSINVTSNYVLADEAAKILKEQGLPASVVLTSSANAVVPKSGSEPYDVSKAAINHLIRELAIGLGPLVRVNGIAPATVVEGSSMFPRDRVMVSLKKYKIAFTEDESTEALRTKLAEFYARRTITHRPILPIDCANAILFLAGRPEREDDRARHSGRWRIAGGVLAVMLKLQIPSSNHSQTKSQTKRQIPNPKGSGLGIGNWELELGISAWDLGLGRGWSLGFGSWDFEEAMQIALFITCYNDTLFPETGKAVVTVLERLGHQVEFREAQTCCGQMHYNTGYAAEALPLMRRMIEVFRGSGPICVPSASCVAMMRDHYPKMAAESF